MHRLLGKFYHHHHHHPFHLLQRELNHEMSKAPSLFSFARNFEGAVEEAAKVCRISPARVQRQGHHNHGLWSHHHYQFLRYPLAVDWAPFNLSIDVRTTPTQYSIDATLPGGVKKGDVKLSLNSRDRTVTIKVNRLDKTQDNQKQPGEALKVESEGKSEAKSEVKADEVSASSKANETASTTETTTNESTYSHRETFAGSVEREVTLPEDANLEGLTAKFLDGVVTINIPKIEPVNYNRSISLD